MNEMEKTLSQRGTRYGKFCDNAWIAQNLKEIMHVSYNWSNLSEDKKEALDMIAHKIARILSGDPEYFDSWLDIAGYAHLIEQTLPR